MAKGGVTRKIADTIKALDENQLKKALYLTEGPKLERQHQWLVEAAQTCLANKDNKKACEEAIKMARDKIKGTVTVPLDDTSMEGLEGFIPTTPQEEQQEPTAGPTAQTDEELYEECQECHVAVAAAKFADICAERPEEAGSCELIGRSLENELTEPIDWLKAMIETAEGAQGSAKEEMVATLTELTTYLEGKDSPFLRALDDLRQPSPLKIVPSEASDSAGNGAKCPICGGPLDASGCCPKCNTCPVEKEEKNG